MNARGNLGSDFNRLETPRDSVELQTPKQSFPIKSSRNYPHQGSSILRSGTSTSTTEMKKDLLNATVSDMRK